MRIRSQFQDRRHGEQGVGGARRTKLTIPDYFVNPATNLPANKTAIPLWSHAVLQELGVRH